MTITVHEAKKKAQRVRARLAELGLTASAAQSLEVLAACFGDANWAAMRARLAKAAAPHTAPGRARAVEFEPPRLGLHTVALYAQLADGGRTFLAQSTVVCWSTEQARRWLYEKHFPGQYESSGYGTAEYVSARIADLDEDTMPELQALCQWLVSLMRDASHGRQVREQLWALLGAKGAACAQASSSGEPEALERALIAAAPGFQGPARFFEALYEAVPASRWYADEQEAFGQVCDELPWAGPAC